MSLTVSIITVTNYDNRSALTRLIEHVRKQTYRNIVEWVIYDQSLPEDIEKSTKWLDRLHNMNIRKNLNIRILNQSPDTRDNTTRMITNHYIPLNSLTEAAMGDIVAMMTDRDVYNSRYVSMYVNALCRTHPKNQQCGYNLAVDLDTLLLDINDADASPDSLMFVAEGEEDSEITPIMGCFFAFRKKYVKPNPFISPDSCYCKINEFDSNTVYVQHDYSFCVPSYGDMAGMFHLVSYFKPDRTGHMYAQNVKNTFRWASQIKDTHMRIKHKKGKENCPVCFTDTNTVLVLCGHPICPTCVKNIHTSTCPICRKKDDTYVPGKVTKDNCLFWDD